MSSAALDAENQGELGLEVLSCRRRRRSAVQVDLVGFNAYIQLFLLPPLVALIVTGGAMFCVAQILKPQGQNIPLAAGLLGLFVTIAVGLYFFIFSTPDTPSLVLHEYGFRYKRRRVLFDDLIAIHIGKDDTALAQLAQDIGSLMSWHPASRVANNSAQASVKLVFNDSSAASLKNVLLENEYEDLEKFFDIVQQDHSRVKIIV